MSVKSKVRTATRAVAKAFTRQSDDAAEVDILDTLKKEHDEVKGLLSDLQKATTAAQRRALVQKIKAALIPHTEAEEKVVYDAVIALRDKDAQVDGHEGYLEHLQGREIGIASIGTGGEHSNGRSVDTERRPYWRTGVDFLELQEVAIGIVEVTGRTFPCGDMLWWRYEIDACGAEPGIFGENVLHVEGDVTDTGIAGWSPLTRARCRIAVAKHFHVHVTQIERGNLSFDVAHSDDGLKRLKARWQL
jgi:hypothetical protein